MLNKKQQHLLKKYDVLKRNVQKYEQQFEQDSSCRNLRNYNHALAALKQFEKKYNVSGCQENEIGDL